MTDGIDEDRLLRCLSRAHDDVQSVLAHYQDWESAQANQAVVVRPRP